MLSAGLLHCSYYLLLKLSWGRYCRPCKYPVSPLILASLGGSCQQLLLVWCSKCYFLFPCPSTLISLNTYVRKSCVFFPCLFSQLFISVHVHYSVNYTLHFAGCNSLLLVFTFLLTLFQLWLSGALPGWSWCPSAGPMLSELILSGTTRCFGLLLCFPCLGPRINQFSKMPCW